MPKPTRWPTSHACTAVRATSAISWPKASCGAATQPIRVKVSSTASPMPAAQAAASPPAVYRGRWSVLAAGVLTRTMLPAASAAVTPGHGGGPAPESGTGPLRTGVRAPVPEQRASALGRLAGGLAHLDAGGLQGLLLGLGGARGPGHDRARVPHRLALRRGEPRHIAHHRLGDVGLDELRRPLLGVPADLADHHDRIGVR